MMPAATAPVPTLAARIAEFQEQLAAQLPSAMMGKLNAEIDSMLRANPGAGAPRPGQPAPRFTLPDARGKALSLDSLLAAGPVVLVFYRGEWCPYCNLAIRSYAAQLESLRAAGASLVAVSPQTPDASLSFVEKANLAFPVLSDHGNRVAREYGLAYALSPGMRELIAGFGIDLARINGDAAPELPVPATFVIGRDGMIRFVHVDADYRTRLEPSRLAEILHQL